MPAITRRFLVSIFLSGLSFCLLSCAEKKYSLSASRDIQMTATEKHNKIPLRAALYIKPQPIVIPEVLKFDLASAFSTGCERMLKNIFREVGSAGLSEKQEFDVMVKPKIIRWGVQGPYRRFWVNLDVVWTICNPDGKTIYFSTVKSEIERNVPALSTSETKVNELKTGYILSMNDQLLRAQEDIYSSKWWTGKW